MIAPRVVAVALCRGWHRFVSPVLPPACRFAPSCSQYAAEAFARHGLMRGGALAASRIARCHPWHPGGYDPVPATPASPGARPKETLSG